MNKIIQELLDKINVDTVLFFDMDGTLIDTNFANFLSYQKAIHTITKLNENLIYNPKHRFNRSNLKDVLPNLSEGEYKRIILKKEEYYKSFLFETKLNEIVCGILFKYSKTNRTVLVTNCRKDRALETLDYFGITDKFTNIFYRQFSHNNKINKFQNAISALNVLPNLIIAFENEEIEIEDAKQAGIKIIINPTSL